MGAQMSKRQPNRTSPKKPEAINELSINIALKVLKENNPNITNIQHTTSDSDTQPKKKAKKL